MLLSVQAGGLIALASESQKLETRSSLRKAGSFRELHESLPVFVVKVQEFGLAAYALRRDNTPTRKEVSVAAKYRQHGYQDRDREEQRRDSAAKSGSAPAKRDDTFGPRKLQMPGTRSVSRCAQCGTVLQVSAADKCPKCGFDLHSCKQCAFFDPSSQFECTKPIPQRIPRKDTRNECTFYEMRVTMEKETSTPASLRPSDARQAFENLFKK